MNELLPDRGEQWRSLRVRLGLLGAFLLGLTLLATWTATDRILHRGFREVETRQGSEAADRLRRRVLARRDRQERIAYDWADWDDARAYLEGRGRKAFEAANFHSNALESLGEDMLAYLAADGSFVGGVRRSPDGSSEIFSDPALIREWIGETPEAFSGLARGGGVIWFVNVRPVRSSRGERLPTDGWLVVASRLDEAERNIIEKDAQLEIVQTVPGRNDRLAVPFAMPLGGPDSLRWTLLLPRPVIPVERRAETALAVALLLAWAVTTALSWLLLERLVLTRILKISRDLSLVGCQIRRDRLGDGTRDEIGALGANLDRLLDDLFASREEIRGALHAAEAANLARDAFLASVTHELRTPLNGILGLVQILLRGSRDPGTRESLELMLGSGETLLTSINDILDFARMETGRIDLIEEEVDLDTSLQTTLRVLAVEAHRKGIEVTLDLDPDLPSRVWIDPHRLRQVLNNLVGNAVKFTDSGDVLVTVRGGNRRGDDRIPLRISVLDTGIGIPAEQLDAIFRPFVQVDPQSHLRRGGAGLGLAIARAIVETMEGEISLRSSPGQGSEFSFTIPVRSVSGCEPVLRPDPDLMLKGRAAVCVGRAAHRGALLSYLVRWGLAPVEFLSPRELLGESGPWGAVFLDAEAAGGDGLPWLSRFRESPAFVGADLVLLGRSNRLSDHERVLAQGLAAVVRCPYVPESLRQVLHGGVPRFVVEVVTCQPVFALLVEGMLAARGHEVHRLDALSVPPAVVEANRVRVVDLDAPQVDVWLSGEVPVVAVGGEPGKEHGHLNRVAKPFEAETLLAALHRAVETA